MNQKVNIQVKSNVEPNVGIVVLNYNTWEDTIECLESLLRLNYSNYRIVVVDNNSTNNSMEYLLMWANGELCNYLPKSSVFYSYSLPPSTSPQEYSYFTSTNLIEKSERDKKLIFIQSDTNGGYSSGNNIGIRYLMNSEECDYVWILNNDIVVDADTLKNTFNHISKLKKTETNNLIELGLFGHKITYYASPNNVQASYYFYDKYFATTKAIIDTNSLTLRLDSSCSYPCGASIFASSDFIESVGLMSEDYFLYYEEPDWAIRGYKKGYNLTIINDAKIYHKEGASAGSNVKGKLRGFLSDYYLLKNRIVITRKFHPKYILTVKLALFGAILNRIRRSQLDRVWMILKMILKE